MTTTGRAPTAPAAAADPTSSDADLDAAVTAVAAGDRAAFALLYDALAPVAHGIAARVLRDPDGAADVTQEVMLEVWRDAPRYLPERGSVQAWVATTAHRRAVDRVRGVRRQSAQDDDARRPPPGHGASSRAEWGSVRNRAQADRVGDCLARLAEEQRRAVLLAYHGARTHREVARELDIPSSAATSAVRDGLLRLRTCLGVP